MPATMQDWYLLPPCLTWVPTMSRPCKSWVFLKDTFFRFHEQDIAAGFDPPHPLKCTPNLFLNMMSQVLAFC